MVQNKFNRPRAHIMCGLRGAQGCLVECRPLPLVKAPRRRFLDQLLVSSLHRAVTLTERTDMSLTVTHNLHLNVPRIDNQLLEIERSVAECRLSLRRCLAERVLKLICVLRDPHAASAASGRCLKKHRISDLLCDKRRLLRIGNQAVRAGNDRNAVLLHERPCGLLVAHLADHIRCRPDPDEAILLTRLGKIRIFGEKSVSRMDGLAVIRLRGRDQRVLIQVAAGSRRRTDTHRLCGE